MSDIRIFHNPACGTSRNVLALIRNSDVELTVVDYLKRPPMRNELVALLAAMNLDVRALLRGDRTPYEDLNLDSPHWSDEQLLDFIGQYPIRTNRTIVPSPQGTRLCRPSEVVLDLLQSSPLGAFSKEDGEVIVDAEGRRAVR